MNAVAFLADLLTLGVSFATGLAVVYAYARLNGHEQRIRRLEGGADIEAQ